MKILQFMCSSWKSRIHKRCLPTRSELWTFKLISDMYVPLKGYSTKKLFGFHTRDKIHFTELENNVWLWSSILRTRLNKFIFLSSTKSCQNNFNFIDLDLTNVISSSLSRGSSRVLIALASSTGNVFLSTSLNLRTNYVTTLRKLLIYNKWSDGSNRNLQLRRKIFWNEETKI